MNASLYSALRSASGRKVKWQGKVVHSVVQFPAKDGDVITVERLKASTTRAQAVKVALDKGHLRANGVLMSTAAIWTHTSPTEARLDVVGRRARSIEIWNSWSFEGVDSAWIGNSGMLVEPDGPGYVLRCSDGVGEATFDDLVVKVVVSSRD